MSISLGVGSAWLQYMFVYIWLRSHRFSVVWHSRILNPSEGYDVAESNDLLLYTHSESKVPRKNNYDCRAISLSIVQAAVGRRRFMSISLGIGSAWAWPMGPAHGPGRPWENPYIFHYVSIHIYIYIHIYLPYPFWLKAQGFLTILSFLHFRDVRHVRRFHWHHCVAGNTKALCRCSRWRLSMASLTIWVLPLAARLCAGQWFSMASTSLSGLPMPAKSHRLRRQCAS